MIVTSTVVCATRLESVCDCCDDLDRIGAALEARGGRRGDVAAAVDADRPAGRGVGREVVGVGEAGLDVGRERDGRVLVGSEGRRVGRDLEDVACVAVERDRVGAVAVGRDGDRAGVAVQGRLVVGSSGLPPTERVPVPGPRLIVPFVEVIAADPEKLGDDVVAAAGERGGTGRDRVRPGGEGLAVERQGTRRYVVSVIETLPVTVAV